MYIILGLLSGCLLMYFILRPKIQKQEALNTSIQQENKEIEQQNLSLKTKKNNLLNETNELDVSINELRKHKTDIQAVISNLTTEKIVLQSQNTELHNNINQLEKTSENFYNTSMESVKKRIASDSLIAKQDYDKTIEKLKEQYNQAVESYQQEYLKIMTDLSEEVANQAISLKNEINKQNNILDDINSKVRAAIEAQKRAQEETEQQDFYRIQLSAPDIKEIEILRDCLPHLRDARPLNKIIWESYYRRPTAELFGRVIGDSIAIGIYKITNIGNGMSYIGQSVDIANRWKTHIRAGLGIDTTNNKLYKAMLEHGVENFTFEILEKCSRDQLNDKEKYWISFYQTDSFGYNLTKGGS